MNTNVVIAIVASWCIYNVPTLLLVQFESSAAVRSIIIQVIAAVCFANLIVKCSCIVDLDIFAMVTFIGLDVLK
jgi:hypothetical protein